MMRPKKPNETALDILRRGLESTPIEQSDQLFPRPSKRMAAIWMQARFKLRKERQKIDEMHKREGGHAR